MTTKRSKTNVLAGAPAFIAEECPQPAKPARRRPARHIEDGEQAALMSWARCTRIVLGQGAGSRVADYLYAIPNGGSRNSREGARLKAAGVKAGVSDLHLPLPRGGYHGLWIELKAPKPHPSTVSAAQREWLQRMREAGHHAVICYGATQAVGVIQNYLAMGMGIQPRTIGRGAGVGSW